MLDPLPPGNDELWDYARNYGYDTSLLHRVEKDDGHLAKQAVDEVLHLKIAEVLLDYDPPQTLVLVTGDGAVSDFGTSFLQYVKRAIKRGWYVDVISWRCQLSRHFRRLAAQSGNSIKVIELEPIYRSITFVREGEFYDNQGNRFNVKGRIVSTLPPS